MNRLEYLFHSNDKRRKKRKSFSVWKLKQINSILRSSAFSLPLVECRGNRCTTNTNRHVNESKCRIYNHKIH